MDRQVRLRTHLSNNQVDLELRRIIDFLAQSSKYISTEINKANRKFAGTINSSDEEQLALDVIADEILLDNLSNETSFSICNFASEEKDNIITPKTNGGKYSIAVDPLDGSSLVDVNLSIGTIIGIHEGKLMSGKSGRESLVASLYIQYGPITTLVYTAKNGVHEFVKDMEGNFVLSKEGVNLKKEGKIYSPGGLRKKWLPEHEKYIKSLEDSGYKLRYSGGFVPDINQILMKGGGLFTYPALNDAPNGKLRLLFELQPMSLIFEQAGGKSTNGKKDILNIIPEELDQRAPIYIGSKNEVEKVKEYMK